MVIEINIVRGILTLILMLSFITLVVWLYARRHQNTFDYAAQLPLEDDSPTIPHSDPGPADSKSQQS